MIPDLKWKDMPKHVSNIIEISPEEMVVSSIPVSSFENENNIIIATKNGMIKRSKLKEFKLLRYSKPTSCMKLKEDDCVIDAFIENKPYIFLVTDSGIGLNYKTEEVIYSAGYKHSDGNTYYKLSDLINLK